MDYTTQIENYLEGRLKAEERKDFEQRLSLDPELAEELRTHREIRVLLDLRKRKLYKEELQALDKSLKQENSMRSSHSFDRLLGWGIGAAAAILIVIGIWWLIPQKNPFQEAFSAYPDRITVRAEGKSQLNQAMEAYNTGDFQEATSLLKPLYLQQPDDAALGFYLGVSQLGAGELDAAVDRLIKIPPSSLYHQAAQWYLALALGQQGKYLKAQELLKQIAAERAHAYAARAQELLDKVTHFIEHGANSDTVVGKPLE